MGDVTRGHAAFTGGWTVWQIVSAGWCRPLYKQIRPPLLAVLLLWAALQQLVYVSV